MKLFFQTWVLYPMNTAMLSRNILFFMALVLFLQSCEKDPKPLTTNSVITGNVYWYSDGADNGKFNITARGPYGSKTIEGTNGGDFLIDRLGNGTYCVEYSKEGYGTYTRCNVRLFGYDTVRINQVELGTEAGNFKMPALIKATISYPNISSPPSPYLTIETDAKDENFCPTLMFFFSSSPDVSWNKYQGYESSIWFADFDAGKKVWMIYLNIPRLNNMNSLCP